MKYGSIVPVHEDHLLLVEDSRKVAMDAVEFYNSVNNRALEFLGVESAAIQSTTAAIQSTTTGGEIQSTTTDGVIYYLTIKSHYEGSRYYLVFQTAVWRIPDIDFIKFIDLRLLSKTPKEVMMEDVGEDEAPEDVINPKILTIAEFAVENHNKKNGTKLKFVKVVDYGTFARGEYLRHCLTLLAEVENSRYPKKKYMLYDTMVTQGEFDTSMESTGLLWLCEAQPHPPYTIPNWIEFGLFSDVRRNFSEPILVFYGNDGVPITFMIKSEDSIRQLSKIANDIGEENIKDKLIPFLSENNKVVSDQVYIKMAQELEVLIQHVGGMDKAHLLLPVLETLCTVEVPLVRERAIETLHQIGVQLKESEFLDFFIPFIEKLAASKCCTARASSCGLFHVAYPRSPKDLRTKLRLLYGGLCRDEMLVVRRSAASNLGHFAATLEPSLLKTDIIPAFKYLTLDDQDSVRLLTVESCIRFMELLEPQDCLEHILPVFLKFSQDNSWYARIVLVNQLDELHEAVALASKPMREDLISAYVRLLRDDKAEVRMAAAGKVSTLCRIFTSQLANDRIFPCIKELASDSSQHVRSSLASGIMGMAPVLGKDATLELLLPIFLLLLKDEYPAVRLNVIRKLDQVTQVIGIHVLYESLLKATDELVVDKDWTVRLAIIKHMPMLARQFGFWPYINELGSLCNKGMKDEVYIVREAASNSLNGIGQFCLNGIGQFCLMNDATSPQPCR